MDSNVVAAEVLRSHIDVMAYPVKNEPHVVTSLHIIAQRYDLFRGYKKSLRFREVCDQFIHSSIFCPFTPIGESLVGIYIASDRVKNSYLYYIMLVKIIEIFRAAGNNMPKNLKVNYDEASQQYVILP